MYSQGSKKEKRDSRLVDHKSYSKLNTTRVQCYFLAGDDSKKYNQPDDQAGGNP